MRARSLAYRTDLGLIAFDGTVEDRGDCLLAHSPANPGFYWGNFLLFPNAPSEGDLERWRQRFATELGGRPGIEHVALGWDDPKGDHGIADEWSALGFEMQDDQVLSLASPPTPIDSKATFRPLVGDDDWRAMEQLNIACDPSQGSSELHDRFKERIRARYRAMVEGGLGVFLGAFVGGELVAELGLFRLDELGRFQCVETHPDHRGQGLCSALVAYACEYGFSELGVERLVIVAEPGAQAERIYRRIGFESAGRQVGAHLAPESERAKSGA